MIKTIESRNPVRALPSYVILRDLKYSVLIGSPELQDARLRRRRPGFLRIHSYEYSNLRGKCTEGAGRESLHVEQPEVICENNIGRARL